MSDIDNLSKINIIQKDKDFLVVEKPVGLLVHSTAHQKDNTLADWLLEYYPEIKGVGDKNRPGVVHRLDKDVSGLMVIAKNQKMYECLVQQFLKNKVRKEYFALVYGRPSQEKGIIELPIGFTRKGKLVAIKSQKDVKTKKSAITEYEIVKNFSIFNFQFSLLKVRPFTGRTHQIRLHLKSVGCPIVGDSRPAPVFLINQSSSYSPRVFLHAFYLGFYDLNGQWREFKSELPRDFKEVLVKIGG